MTHRVHAFGGLWSSPDAPVTQTAERIIFVDNPDSTVTAIVQISYAGPSKKFAWLIPVRGTPTVGISSNTVFERLDTATVPEYWVEVSLENTCVQPDGPDASVDTDSGASDAPSETDTTPQPAAQIDQGSVGPYDYVTLAVDPTVSDRSQVASDWLTTNGYELGGVDSKLLATYLNDGLNLLAFKLTEGKDAGAIRPVILTYESEYPVIPIRPTSVAAQADMGIQVWVIGPSQAVPGNYKSLLINDALIDWSSAETYKVGTLPSGGVGPFGEYVRTPSNYEAVVGAAANEAGGQGFLTELAGPASQFRDKVWSQLDDDQFASVSTQKYADGIDAILAASVSYAAWDGWRDSLKDATTLPPGVTLDAFARDPEHYRGAAAVDTARFLQRLEEKVVRPVSDTAALLYNAPYLTRLFSTMSAGEMTLDPVFDYNFDLAQVSNVHIAKQYLQCVPMSDSSDAPWRLELPQGGVIVGRVNGGWPVAEGSLPANLKIVKLSAEGSGTVVKDNSEQIGMTLFERAGTTGSGSATARPPQVGLSIGGTQSVRPYEESAPMQRSSRSRRVDACSVSHVGVGGDSARASWWTVAGLMFALRRRSRKERKKS
jgi:hypothetical protein